MACEVIIDKVNQKDWERYASNFADYNIYQTWAYQQVRAQKDGCDVSRAVIKDENDKVVTMCQIRIKHIKPLSLRIGYAQWGPLLRDKDNKITCSIEALQQLRAAYFGTKVNVFRIVPNAYADEYGQVLAGMLQSAGFDYAPKIKPYRTFILSVDDSEENIRKRLRKSFRRDLKYAEKAGIETKEGTGRKFCSILENLYFELLKRKGFKGLDPQEFIMTQDMLSTPEKMNIIVACLDGEPVAVHLTSNLGNKAIVLLAASNEKGLRCGASYLVWYNSAVSALHAGMKWHDLGGIDPDNNPNVYQFKSRMGGKEVSYIGAFEASTSMTVKKVWQTAEKVYRLVSK